MKAGNKIFEGLSVNDNPLVIGNNNTPDCKNVLVNNPIGALTNIEGMEKQHTSEYANDIVGIHQLNEMGLFGDSGEEIICVDKVMVTDDSFVGDDGVSDRNFGNNAALWACKYENVIYRAFIKQGVSKKRYLNLYAQGLYGASIFDVHQIADTWEEDVITWDNQPAAGVQLVSAQEVTASGWVKFDLGAGYADIITIMIKLTSETTNNRGCTYYSSESAAGDYNPYFSDL